MSAPALPEAQLLLLGEAAQALASRLQVSGYGLLPLPAVLASADAPSDLTTPASAAEAELAYPEALPPDAVILSAASEAAIALCRRCWPEAVLLLGVEEDSVAARHRCLTSGADDFWLQHQGPSDLLTRLRLHLAAAARRRPPPPSDQLRLADLVVEPRTHRVRRGERSVTLTAREYALLLLLLQARSQVVSREDILRQIWSHDQSGSNVIEVYVRYLRQKLEAGGERRLLHTVRGQGYCLSEGLPSRQPESGPSSRRRSD